MNWRKTVILSGIILLAFLFRFLGTNVPALNGDEGDLFDSFLDVSERNITPWQRWIGDLPPLSTWTATIVMRVLGTSEWALRFYGAIFGPLTVLVIYFLAKLHYNSKTAMRAALISSVLPLFVVVSSISPPGLVS